MDREGAALFQRSRWRRSASGSDRGRRGQSLRHNPARCDAWRRRRIQAHTVNMADAPSAMLLDDGHIPFHRPGKHRRVRVSDLVGLKAPLERDRVAALRKPGLALYVDRHRYQRKRACHPKLEPDLACQRLRFRWKTTTSLAAAAPYTASRSPAARVRIGDRDDFILSRPSSRGRARRRQCSTGQSISPGLRRIVICTTPLIQVVRRCCHGPRR